MPDKLARNKKGQALVETLVALSIIFLGVLGVFTLFSRSFNLTRQAANQQAAAYLAGEGIEIVKNMIDRNFLQNKPWNEGLAPGVYETDFNDAALTPAVDPRKFLFFDPSAGFYQYETGTPTIFRRSIIIEWLGAGAEMKVRSLVEWSSAGAGFSVDLEDHFYDWRS